MPNTRDFVIDLAKSNETAKNIKIKVDNVYKEDGLSMSQIYRIMAQVREGKDLESQQGRHTKHLKRTTSNIALIQDLVHENRHATLEELAEMSELSTFTVHNILRMDLGLSKKAARWVPRLLSGEQKQARIDAANVFKNLAESKGEAFLRSIVTMDETMVSFYTPKTKNQSKEWLPKGSPAPTKPKHQEMRKKQMVLIFFDSSGIIYTKYEDIGIKVDSSYIVDVLGSFFKALRAKRPHLMSKEWWFHWDNAPVH